MVFAWGDPDSNLASVLASAAGWPWLIAALLGARVWWRGHGRTGEPFEHFLAVYAAGTAAALTVGAAILFVAGSEFSALPCPAGPLAAPCTVLVSMALAAVFAGLTLGFAFPALLPVAAAVISAATLRDRPPSGRRLRAAIAAVAASWLLAAAGGLVLAHA
ncbi:MAG: hypothetical protein OXP70_02200 [Acidobacteriota bacterium]|nr:hypothetical protein [Acidobacteriota bacterium]